ncbi:hypothetical protein SFC65_19255 [Priestia filamentosa]|uniref:hypothetical protein n=1 Tax=Priestia filamentosa TaxID=1402861 RepID=UPI003982AE5B
MNILKLGTFEIKGEQLIVSDPCYEIECATDPDDDLSWALTPAKSGEWEASIYEGEDISVDKLMVCYKGYKPNSEWIDIRKEVAVDSASAGIFDGSIYGKDESIPYKVENVYEIDIPEEGLKYYVACCDVIAKAEEEAGLVPGGVVSTSSGDGYFPIFVQYNEQEEIVAVLLDFYGEEEDETDE